MVITNSDNSSDIAGYFDDEFYNSAVIYQIPRLSRSDYQLTYLMREDLVSNLRYGTTDYTGVVLLSCGEIVTVTNKTITKNFQPAETVQLMVYSEITSYLPTTKSSNTMSDSMKSSDNRLVQEQTSYEYNGSTFVAVTSGD